MCCGERGTIGILRIFGSNVQVCVHDFARLGFPNMEDGWMYNLSARQDCSFAY